MVQPSQPTTEKRQLVYVVVAPGEQGSDAVMDVWSDMMVLHDHLVDFCGLDYPEADALKTELENMTADDGVLVDGWEVLVREIKR